MFLGKGTMVADFQSCKGLPLWRPGCHQCSPGPRWTPLMEEGLLTVDTLSAPHPITLSYSSPDHFSAQPSHVADPQLADEP